MARAPQTDLEEMSVKELVDLHAKVKAAIADRHVTERAELKAKMVQLAADSGLSLEEVLGLRKGRAAKGPSVAKFRNPDDANDTWTGRGRKPNWLVERLKKRGTSMEDFKI